MNVKGGEKKKKKKENQICNGAQFPSGVCFFFLSLLYKEEVATKHQFPRIACCQRHMRLIYITSLHYGWYILQLVVHRADINYSLVIIHFVLNHCPGAATLTSSPLCLQLFFFNFLLSVSSFNLAPFTASTQTNKQDFLSFFFALGTPRDCVFFYVNRPPICFFFFSPLSNKQI